MPKKLKEILSDTKTWILLGIFFVGILSYTAGFLELPRRVDALEVGASETKGSVDRLADTVEDYILMQTTYHKNQEQRYAEQRVHDAELRASNAKREDDMFILIQEIRREKNSD